MLVARAGLSPVMVGRDAELEQLRRLFSSLSTVAAPPPVVTVSGEAGVGKTRLLRELGDVVAAEGGNVLAGRADELTLAPPFGVLRDALQGVVAAWDGVPAPLAGREHAVRHVLSPLLAEHDDRDDHEHTADELVRAAVDVVVHAVGDRPTLVVFEDLHWADGDSIALYSRLAATPGLPVLLVATFRPEEFDRRHPLAQALPALERQRSVVHLPLGRLSEPALAHMLEAVFRRPVPARAVAALHRRTQGNPFFVEELVAGCGCTDPAELAEAPLPWNAAEAVLRRVDELEPEARRVLAAAALLGSRVAFDLLAAVLDTGEDELIGVLHVLVDRGLLAEADVDVFAFRHALTREAVAGMMLGREQRRIQQAALAALEAQGSDDVLALAHRAAGAGQPAKLVRYATDGVSRLLREGSALQALQLAELAIARAEPVEPVDELALRSAAARAAWLVGLVDVAAHHTDRWRLLAIEEKLRAEEAAALRHDSMLCWHVGDREGYWRTVRAARGVAEELGPSAELAWCYAFESQAHMLDGDAGEAIALADRALEMAERIGAPEVRPWALVNKGMMLLTERQGQEAEGLRLLEVAAEESLVRGDATTTLRALNNALVHHVYQRPDGGADARRLLARARTVSDRFGAEVFAANLATLALALAVNDGDQAAAEAVLDGTSLPLDDPYRAGLVAWRAFLRSERGDHEEAARLLGAAQGDERSGQAELASWWETVRLEVSARSGARAVADDAVRRLEALVARDDWFLSKPQIACQALLAGIAAGLDSSRLARLLAAATPAEGAGRHPLFPEAWIAHAQAALAARAGDHEAAADGYRRTVSSRSPRPAWILADAHLGLARSLVALGARDEALAEAELAERVLRDWPGWRREEAGALVHRIGGARTSEPHVPGGLTPRELEVLALVTGGLSNREIAERLFIATKTVAVHVSNILAKTGASSRTEAATWALRTGVVEALPSTPRAPSSSSGR